MPMLPDPSREEMGEGLSLEKSTTGKARGEG